MKLGCGRGALFPLAEQATFDDFKEKRALGLRVGPRLLSALMKRHVANFYGREIAKTFKSARTWRRLFALRHSISLKKASNKKSVSAAERLPKIKRWLARFRRLLRKNRAAFKKPVAHPEDPKAEENLRSVAHRGNDGTLVIARQGSHGVKNDCGLCALKNVTVCTQFSLQDAQKIAPDLDSEGTVGMFTPVTHGDDTGNFSGTALSLLAYKFGYGAYTAMRPQSSEQHPARALVEMFCILLNERVTGVIWREGTPMVAPSNWGHWIAASHIPNLGHWTTHTWAIKDSMGDGRAHLWSTLDVLNKLDKVDSLGFDVYVIVDLVWD